MLSRARKYRNSFQSYEQAIQKQLNDDFQVAEYIDQNKLQGNMQEYLKLCNSLQVTKNEKKKKCECLRVSYSQMSTQREAKNLQSSKIENWDQIKEEFQNSYEEMQIKTINEIQVKNNLWKQILQTKKSLNLLKGDIGHLVSRNQSANLLQSKITKVKIVADDQLKRVSLAYVKDKEELKIRGDMQKKFNKKLKNVSMFENSTLNKFKKNYIDTMVKKKKIHDRLTYIEKVSASINETGDKQKLKNKINKNSLEMYNAIKRLGQLIEKIPEIEQKYGNTSEEIHQFINEITGQVFIQQQSNPSTITKSTAKSRMLQTPIQNINSEDLSMITKQSLDTFSSLILKENNRLVQQISKRSSEYDWQVKKSQQIIAKLEQCNLQISNIHSNQIDQASLKYILTQQMRHEYSCKLKKFIQLLKTIFALLQYIQKYLDYSNKGFEHHHNSKESPKLHKKQKTMSSSYNISSGHEKVSNILRKSIDKQSSCLLKPLSQSRSRTQISSDSSLILVHQGYISELYKTYYTLLKEDQSETRLNAIDTSIFDHLLVDTGNWLTQIKNDILEGSKRLVPQFTHKHQKSEISTFKPKTSFRSRDSAISHIKPQKNGLETEEQEFVQIQNENSFLFQHYNRHHTVHREENLQRYHSFRNSLHFGEQNKFSKMGNGPSIHRGTQKIDKASSPPNIVNVSRLKNCASPPVLNEKKAMRIKFLEDLDKDYYKILKSTLKMQKENTRKNYQFLRTFKRAKYSSRDQILEEKRYQCSYSILFAGKKNLTQNIQHPHKKSNFFTNQNTSVRVSKMIEPHRPERSSKLIKSCVSSLNLNEKEACEMKENIQKIKAKIETKNKETLKRNLSIQMKDIINLV